MTLASDAEGFKRALQLANQKIQEIQEMFSNREMEQRKSMAGLVSLLGPEVQEIRRQAALLARDESAKFIEQLSEQLRAKERYFLTYM